MVKELGPWDTLKSFGLKFGKTQGEIGENVNLDDINQFYCTMGFPNGVTPYDTLDSNNLIDKDKTGAFIVNNVFPNEVITAWKGLKHKKSKTPDTVGLSKLMMGLILPIPCISELITSFFNESFATGVVPTQLKNSRVVPIPKIPNASEPDDFRPLSLTTNLLMWMEKIYSNRLEVFISKNNILCDVQFGFRKYHSTEHLILALTDDIRLNLDIGKVCAVITVDYQKCFDSIPREKLLLKLFNLYNISDHWLRSYLSDREQFVNVGRSNSRRRKSLTGLPAGSILAARLFSLYMNDLCDVLTNGKVVSFADDSTFYFFGDVNNLNILELNVYNDMNNVVKYVKDNGMTLHPNKTKMLLLGNQSNLRKSCNFNVVINNVTIEHCDKLKCVGMMLDSKLTYEHHINDIAKRAYYRIRCLYTVKHYFSKESMKTIGVAIVMSIINYMSCVWGATSAKYLHVIEKVIRSLGRLVLNIKKYDSVANDISLDLKWFFPTDMCNYRTLCIMFKLIKYDNVPFFTNYFCKISALHNHCTRSAENNFRSTTKPKTEFARNSFNYRGVSLWNDLPISLKDESSYYVFKTKLKEHLLKLKL
jgi:hypothetical protein